MSVLVLSADCIFAEALVLELKQHRIEAEMANLTTADESRLVICDIDSAEARPQDITFTRDRAKQADFLRPFRTAELIAEVTNRLNRRHADESANKSDRLCISGTCVRIGNREIILTATEAALLNLLASRPGIPFSREEIGRAVWGEDSIDTNRCEVYIRYLREKLEQSDEPRRILTVRGKGYMLNPLT